MTLIKRPRSRRSNLVVVQNFVKRLVEPKEPTIEELRREAKKLART